MKGIPEQTFDTQKRILQNSERPSIIQRTMKIAVACTGKSEKVHPGEIRKEKQSYNYYRSLKVIKSSALCMRGEKLQCS